MTCTSTLNARNLTVTYKIEYFSILFQLTDRKYTNLTPAIKYMGQSTKGMITEVLNIPHQYTNLQMPTFQDNPSLIRYLIHASNEISVILTVTQQHANVVKLKCVTDSRAYRNPLFGVKFSSARTAIQFESHLFHCLDC
jgi:hypothetical protein